MRFTIMGTSDLPSYSDKKMVLLKYIDLHDELLIL